MEKLKYDYYASSAEFIKALSMQKGAKVKYIKVLKQHSLVLDSISERNFDKFKKHFNPDSELNCFSVDFWGVENIADLHSGSDFAITTTDEFLKKSGLYMNAVFFTFYFQINRLGEDEDFSFFRNVLNFISDSVIKPLIKSNMKESGAEFLTAKERTAVDFLGLEMLCVESVEELNEVKGKVEGLKSYLTHVEHTLKRSVYRGFDNYVYIRNIRSFTLSNSLRVEILKLLDDYTICEVITTLNTSSSDNHFDLVSESMVQRLVKDDDILAIDLNGYLLSHKVFLENMNGYDMPISPQFNRFTIICREVFRKKLKLESDLDLTSDLYSLLLNYVKILKFNQAINRSLEASLMGRVRRPRLKTSQESLAEVVLNTQVSIRNVLLTNEDIFKFLEYINMDEYIWKPIYQYEILNRQLKLLNNDSDIVNDTDDLSKL